MHHDAAPPGWQTYRPRCHSAHRGANIHPGTGFSARDLSIPHLAVTAVIENIVRAEQTARCSDSSSDAENQNSTVTIGVQPQCLAYNGLQLVLATAKETRLSGLSPTIF